MTFPSENQIGRKPFLLLYAGGYVRKPRIKSPVRYQMRTRARGCIHIVHTLYIRMLIRIYKTLSRVPNYTRTVNYNVGAPKTFPICTRLIASYCVLISCE